MSLGGDHDFSLEEGRGSRVRVSDVVMLSVMVCTLLLLLSLHDARLMIWYERPLSRARSLAESSETSPPPPPPLPPPSPPPEYANLPRAVSFLSRNLEDNYMCEVGEVRASCHAAASSPTHHTITFTSCTRHSALAHHHTANHRQAVRLELLTEKAALHADRIMKEQAVTPPCSRLQAARSELAHLLPLRPSPSPLPPSIPSSLLALPDPPSPPSLALALPRFLRLPAPRSPSLMSLMSLMSLSLFAFGCLLFSRGTRSTPRDRCRLPLCCSRP